MNRSSIHSLLLALGLVFSGWAAAQTLTDAEVKKVDKPAARVTLKHGEIKTLDIPAMTMVYRVKDAAWLDKLQAGDKVRFAAERANSEYTITQIEPAR